MFLKRRPKYDGNRQAEADNQVGTGTEPASFDTNRHSLTQSLLAAGLDPGPGRCPCGGCNPEAEVVETAPGEIFVGWRRFNMQLNWEWKPVLLGSTSTVWAKRKHEAICGVPPTYGSSLVRTPRQLCLDHLRRGACSCGIYITKYDPRVNFPASTYPLIVMGTAGNYCPHYATVYAYCAGYGVVVEGDYGYRVSDCRIDALWIPEFLPEWVSDSLIEKYEAPVKRVTDGSQENS